LKNILVWGDGAKGGFSISQSTSNWKGERTRKDWGKQVSERTEKKKNEYNGGGLLKNCLGIGGKEGRVEKLKHEKVQTISKIKRGHEEKSLKGEHRS